MADIEQLELLEQGVEVWNGWRDGSWAVMPSVPHNGSAMLDSCGYMIPRTLKRMA